MTALIATPPGGVVAATVTLAVAVTVPRPQLHAA